MKHIKVSGKKSINIAKTILVSDKDYPLLSKTKWSINSSGYATNGKIYMHQIIMPSAIGKEIDHKDGDKLNNTRSNLRYATRSENHANRKCINKFKGIRKKTDTFRNKPWTANIGFNYKTIRLGHFKTEVEAALAYNKKALEIYGAFARINIV